MKRVHLDIGDSKIACQLMPPPTTYLRTTEGAAVTCVCCKSYVRGDRPVGDFCETTRNKHRQRADKCPYGQKDCLGGAACVCALPSAQRT